MDSKNKQIKTSSNEIFNTMRRMSKDNSRTTLEDRITQHTKSIKDAYGNTLNATGTYDVVSKFNRRSLDNDTNNMYLWLSLYNDSWVFKKAIDKPAQDMVRSGISIALGNEDQRNDIYITYKSYNPEMIQLLQWGALFGGSIAVMMFDNFANEDYAKPLTLNKKKVRESRKMSLYVVDRWFGVAQSTEVVENMIDDDFSKPKYYDITFADGKTFRVHHDYVLRYQHRVAPKIIERGPLMGWGYAEGAHILNEIMSTDELNCDINSLVNKSLIEVIKMDGMKGLFMGADEASQEQLTKRLEMVNWGRGFNSLTFLDTNDDYQMNSFSGLTGLSDILQQKMWEIAAALDMSGVLFGDLKGGFSTDEDALERYAQTILDRCETYYRGIVKKLLKMIYLRKGIDEEVDFEFISLIREKKDKESMEATKDFVALLSQLLGDGVLTMVQYAKALDLYLKKGIVDLGINEESLKQLEEDEKNQLESIDLDEDEESDEKAEERHSVKLSMR